MEWTSIQKMSQQNEIDWNNYWSWDDMTFNKWKTVKNFHCNFSFWVGICNSEKGKEMTNSKGERDYQQQKQQPQKTVQSSDIQ